MVQSINEINQLQGKGYGVCINSLWSSLNGGHDDDNSVDNNKPD
ncbi:hypothetical protein [Flavobacterium luteolum]